MKLKPGEKLIDKLESTEDTKGNNGDTEGLTTEFQVFTVWYGIE